MKQIKSGIESTPHHKVNIWLSAVVIMILLLTSFASSAGDQGFRELQNIKLPFAPSTHWYSHTDDFKFFLCSTKTDMLMFDGTTGKILWQKNFEKDFANKKFSYQYWNMNANVVLVYDEDTKKGIATKYFIDGKTGSLLWSSDKYISDQGDYRLSTGFGNYYDAGTNSVLLPTLQSVDLVNVTTGNTIWSKPYTLGGKSKDFDCYIMEYHDLVKIVTGEDKRNCFTINDGTEVTDIDPYFNKKKYLSDLKNAKIIDIPDKDMYVLMLAETDNVFSAFTGIDFPKMNMSFMGYNASTDQLVWSKTYFIACAFDWVSEDEYFAKMHYADGNLFIEHNSSGKPNTGLTVLDPLTGERVWEANFSASEIKTVGLGKNVTTPFPAPDPVALNGKTYVVNKAKNIVTCYESATGMKVWDSEKYPDAQKIPTLILSDGLLIMGYGGDELKCASIIQDKGPNIERYEFNNKDKYGINAYDATTGKIVWDGETAGKKVKEDFSFIAGLQLIDGKLFCATDNNFLILDPKTGDVLNSLPVANEKLGNAWKMFYFPEQGKIVLNCDNGVIKISPQTVKIEGTVKTPTVAFYQASKFMHADDPYLDYAVFTSGDGEKMTFKEFASIDLDKMAIRGVEDGSLLMKENPHFSEGGEMFMKIDGESIRIFSIR